MRLVRPALAVAVVGSLAAAGIASAAPKPKPVCNLVTDAADDATGAPLAGTPGVAPNGPAYDITSLDVASNATTLTGVVRVKALSKTSSTAPSGIHWTIGFTVAGSDFQLSAHNDAADGEAYELDSVDKAGQTYDKIADATGVLDVATNEVRISIPASALGVKLTGQKVTDIAGTAGAFYNVPMVVSGEDATDTATGDAAYTAGALSCVTPGK